ncbi:aminodeoxychorismate synthase component I [Alkalibacillus haloalkaliphilus]|uniref:aminodeoxychorismate synthase component I n=1 Tax=Alkalibacillus haloalkaliphilus TaxID=94136 RepID=UPI0029368EE3|nr:aminodeoxychorismate synthase component I [Alkalibacillus haloalkaliphilus]MDV2581310.1 aminodeoxychorismate synthase component I [Alkalibacillus haloalkaliphilus]
MNDVKLTFRFKHRWLESDSLHFREPVNILQANTIEEVEGTIKQAETYAQNGYYVGGFVSYEAAQTFLPHLPFHDVNELPYVWFGVFEKPVEQEGPSNETFVQTEWKPDTSKQAYEQAIQTIHNLISQGITYQVNYTLRLLAELEGVDSKAWYSQLAQAQQANYTALLQIGSHDILSISPELFFASNGHTIETRPMKGTMRRGLTVEEDDQFKVQLSESTKDRAENVMIVDLLRNDVSQVAKAGTVQVPELFTIEHYPTVHQMTSTIQAELKEEAGLVDLFKALFPCGSITGAPKQSTMEQIHHLENSPREVYCGAIGLLTPHGEAVFNVPIRTVLYNRETNQAVYGVGGGITWDSSAEGEYEETVDKARVLYRKAKPFQLLETMLLKDGVIELELEHINRLKRSAKYFNINLNDQTLTETIDQIKAKNRGEYKVRLLIDQQGQITYELHPISKTSTQLQVALAYEPIRKGNAFLYHKTTNRSFYNERMRANVDETLLWNEEGLITEFTTGNVAYKLEGNWYTPPVEDGLLPGTYRERLLRKQQITERSLAKDDLERVEGLAFFNSVRGWKTVHLITE